MARQPSRPSRALLSAALGSLLACAVAFQAGRGAPASLTLPALMSLSESDVAGVRYLSGVATYSRTLDLAQAPSGTDALLLDLGQVGGIARVRVNGSEAGIVWRPPFRVDVAKWLHAGANRIEVEVANSWKNRLIGDQQEGMTQVAFAPSAAEDPDGPLLPSGLLGPVRLPQLR